MISFRLPIDEERLSQWESGAICFPAVISKKTVKKPHLILKTPCAGRIVKEKDVEDAVALAFGKLPCLRQELMSAKQKAQTGAEVQKVKSALEGLDEREESIQDRISRFAESGELDRTETEGEITTELEQMKVELDAIQKEKDELLRQKADYDFKACQVDALLTLIDEMEGKVKPAASGTRPIPTETEKERYGTYWPEIERQLRTYSYDCREISDFYERTTVHRHRGMITAFDNDDAQRYIDKIVVRKEKMEVVFKAGVSVTVEKQGRIRMTT